MFKTTPRIARLRRSSKHEPVFPNVCAPVVTCVREQVLESDGRMVTKEVSKEIPLSELNKGLTIHDFSISSLQSAGIDPSSQPATNFAADPVAVIEGVGRLDKQLEAEIVAAKAAESEPVNPPAE